MQQEIQVIDVEQSPRRLVESEVNGFRLPSRDRAENAHAFGEGIAQAADRGMRPVMATPAVWLMAKSKSRMLLTAPLQTTFTQTLVMAPFSEAKGLTLSATALTPPDKPRSR